MNNFKKKLLRDLRKYICMYLITDIIYVYWNLKINLIYDIILQFAGQHNNVAIKKV